MEYLWLHFAKYIFGYLQFTINNMLYNVTLDVVN